MSSSFPESGSEDSSIEMLPRPDYSAKRRKLLEYSWDTIDTTGHNKLESADDLTPAQVLLCHQILNEAIRAFSSSLRATPQMLERFLSAIFTDWTSDMDTGPATDFTKLNFCEKMIALPSEGFGYCVGVCYSSTNGGRAPHWPTKYIWGAGGSTNEWTGTELTGEELAMIEWKFGDSVVELFHDGIVRRAVEFTVGIACEHNEAKAVQAARHILKFEVTSTGLLSGKEFVKMETVMRIYPSLRFEMSALLRAGETISGVFENAVRLFKEPAIRIAGSS